MCTFKNLCAQCACKAYRNQRLPGPLELELQTFVNPRVHAMEGVPYPFSPLPFLLPFLPCWTPLPIFSTIPAEPFCISAWNSPWHDTFLFAQFLWLFHVICLPLKTNKRDHAAFVIWVWVTSIRTVIFSSTQLPANFIILLYFMAQ